MAVQDFVIDADPTAAIAALDGIKNGQQRAVTRAINRTLITWRAEAARLIRVDTGLKVGVIKDAMRINNANFSRLAGSVIVTGKRIPLIEFGATGPEPSRGRGRVTYRVGPGRRTTVPGAFIATMHSGHRGVFKRRSPRRLPIVELRGPSLPKVAANAAIVKAFETVADAALQKNLAHEVEFLLENRKGA